MAQELGIKEYDNILFFCELNLNSNQKFGIIPLVSKELFDFDDMDFQKIKDNFNITKTMEYLSRSQNSLIPFLKVQTKYEREIYGL